MYPNEMSIASIAIQSPQTNIKNLLLCCRAWCFLCATSPFPHPLMTTSTGRLVGDKFCIMSRYNRFTNEKHNMVHKRSQRQLSIHWPYRFGCDGLNLIVMSLYRFLLRIGITADWHCQFGNQTFIDRKVFAVAQSCVLVFVYNIIY